MATTSRRLDLDTYRRRKSPQEGASSTKTPPFVASKQVMSFHDFEQRSGNKKLTPKKQLTPTRCRKSISTPRGEGPKPEFTPSASRQKPKPEIPVSIRASSPANRLGNKTPTITVAAEPSPSRLRIRQQILKPDEAAMSRERRDFVGSSPARTLSALDQQQRQSTPTAADSTAERRKRYVESRMDLIRRSTDSPRCSSMERITPVTALDEAAFFTPSPLSNKEIEPAGKKSSGTSASARQSSVSTRAASPHPKDKVFQKKSTSSEARENVSYSKPTSSSRSKGGLKAKSTGKGTSSSSPTTYKAKASNLIKERRKSSRTPPLAGGSNNARRLLSVRTSRSPLKSPKRHPASRSSDSSGPDTRRNLDKRSARLKYAGDFIHEIDRFRKEQSPAAVVATPKSRRHDENLQVFVRKRPIFAQQLEHGDFDVVQCIANDTVVVYKATMASDMKTKMVQPVSFSGCIASAFDEQTGSEQVYREAVQPLVKSVVLQGNAATLLMFGQVRAYTDSLWESRVFSAHTSCVSQYYVALTLSLLQTGSGKTYTMTACQKLVAAEIFSSQSIKHVEVSCLELVGKRCRDLMNTNDDAPDVRIADREDGSVSFVHATTEIAKSPRELISTLVRAQKNRATHATEVNDVSSRSHAIYQIRVIETRRRSGGVLTLLDCAGTERRNDSLYHDKERQAESTEINASLYALKECIRVRSRNNKGQKKLRVPYRSSNLTRILRESLECQDARLAVIATVSPNATDTEHSIQTLKTVSTLTDSSWEEGDAQKLMTPSPTSKGVYSSIPPKKWSHEELVQWLKDKRFLGKTEVPGHLNGKAVMRMSKLQLQYTLYDDLPEQENEPTGSEKAENLFKSLRAETDLVSRLELKRRMATKSQ